MAKMLADAVDTRELRDRWPAEPQRTTCKQDKACACAWSQLHRYDSSGCDSLEQWAEWTEHRSHSCGWEARADYWTAPWLKAATRRSNGYTIRARSCSIQAIALMSWWRFRGMPQAP